MISVSEISKNFGEIAAVNKVSFEAKPGEVLGILGPNGAGKTTIMKMLTGYHYPCSGEVHVGGFPITSHANSAKKIIGYLPENAPLYGDLQVSEFLRFAAGMRGMKSGEIDDALARTLSKCGIQRVSRQRIDTLSKGYRQRVGIAQAIIHDPPILILDEPTSGLDPLQVQEIRRLIIESGKNKTVLFSSHIMQEVEAVCTRIIILHLGKIIAEGTSDEIASRLKADTVYEVSLSGADSNTILRSLETDKSCIRAELIRSTSAQRHRIRISLSIDNQDEAGAALFRFAAGKGYVLSELTPVQYGLEEIFTALMAEEDMQ
ncbi:ABC transporter ATP-binding protein [Spirochaeta dissipatitropha]